MEERMKWSLAARCVALSSILFVACADGASSDAYVDDIASSAEAEGGDPLAQSELVWSVRRRRRDAGAPAVPVAVDASLVHDAGPLGDAGMPRDASAPPQSDAGSVRDAGAVVDAALPRDAGPPVDAGPAGTGGMRVGTNFWFLGGSGEAAFASSASFAAGANPWNPTFLTDLRAAHFGTFRFMDWAGINNSTLRSWSQRTQPTSADNATQGNWAGRGIAYEWMFDLCNRMEADCWITVPHLAIESYEQNPNDNFFTSLAALAKAKLDSGRKLIVEYSNETWNPGFQQALYSQSRGVAAGYASDGYSASFKFHVYASSRMYDAFQKVFGGEASRLRWVVCGQLGSDWGTQKQVEALADARINLGMRTPHFYGISSYVGSDGSIDGAAGDVVAQFTKQIGDTVATARQQRSTIASTGMALVAYEGGQHITSHAAAFSRNPAAYELYTRWLDATASLYTLTMHYAFSGQYSDGGAWGSKEYVGQPLSQTPKARALLDWIDAHR
jgi:hypothetical protein